jgi:hypothetical protein
MRAVEDEVVCDLEHDRATRAVVRLVVRSSRVGRAGHPMVRDVMVCAGHARQLRRLGIEVISPT